MRIIDPGAIFAKGLRFSLDVGYAVVSNQSLFGSAKVVLRMVFPKGVSAETTHQITTGVFCIM